MPRQMLAHIRGGQVIGTYHDGKGRVTFGNGQTVSPPAAGVYGDEQLVPIVVVTVDKSTTTRTTSASVDTVEADRVLRTVTISDMTIEDIRAALNHEVNRTYSEAMEPLSKAYPLEEREGWAEQVEASKEVIAGGQNDLIDTLREPTGETALEMAEKILRLRAQYRVMYGGLTAARRGLYLQIANATTLTELQAVDVRAGFGLS
jgi:hypothetical protein